MESLISLSAGHPLAVKALRELLKDAERLKHLHDDPKRAQAYFWNHQGRKERNAAIDEAMK